MQPKRNVLIVVTLLACGLRGAAQDQLVPVGPARYTDAVHAAKDSRKMLLIQFHTATETERDRQLATQLRDELSASNLSDQFVVAHLPVDYEIHSDGEPVRLLNHAAFAHMHGRAGIAIVDFRDPASKTFHHVVSIYPLTNDEAIGDDQLAVLLELPPGTLTQRTLIFAVRTHPESPASAVGEFHSVLADEAESHSRHQADIRLQGHHHWEQRFQRINPKLAAGLLAQEVCAESWPGQELLEAARECVHSWRQSSGHWDAVKSRHPVFGYDMKRGTNGVWYATGIFGRPH